MHKLVEGCGTLACAYVFLDYVKLFRREDVASR